MSPLLKEFNRLAREASRPDANIILLIAQHKIRLRKILQKVYSATIEFVANRTMEEANENAKASFAKIEKKDFDGEILRLISIWLFTNAFIVSSTIAGTSSSLILKAISDNIGEGQDVVARAIRNAVGGAVGLFRSRMIARTETHDASQAAQLNVVQNMDFKPEFKQWVAILDDRVRDDHRFADDQTRRLNEPFDVGGKKMDRPGDRRGGAAQVINCRCVMVFVDNDT